MDRKRVVFLGVAAVLALVVVGTAAYLFATPDAKTSEAADLFDAPRAGDGALCFRSNDSGGEFLTSVDARDPDHTVQFFRSSNQVTRVDHYATNDTRVAVYNFPGDRGESRYRARLARLRNEENVTVVAAEGTRRIRAVERNVSRPPLSGGGSLLLIPSLEVLRWERVNATAYRPVGGYVETTGPGGSNATSYVDWARGVVRTDGNGSVLRAEVTYGVVTRVQHTFEPLFRDAERVHLSFDRTVCRPDPVEPPAGS